MCKHLKDTVNCVASGKEQHITVTEVYEMLQRKNQRYRWKHAFQAEFDEWIKMDCAKTAMKLKKYITAFEENSIKMFEDVKLENERLHEQNADHSTNDVLIDGTASVRQQFTDQSVYKFTVSPKCTNKQEFSARNHDKYCNQSWLSSISSNSSIDKSIIIED